MIRRRIDAVVTFNDTLERNRTALDVAASLGLHSFVLENGYLRPF
jgi:capsular polysaccharide export protein